MKKPSEEEIKKEIIELESLVPIGRFASKTAESIDFQIEVLRNGFDDTSDEYNELSEEQQMNIQDTLNWKNGFNQNKPSKEWGGLCEKIDMKSIHEAKNII
jgi:hypothetical protein